MTSPCSAPLRFTAPITEAALETTRGRAFSSADAYTGVRSNSCQGVARQISLPSCKGRQTKQQRKHEKKKKRCAAYYRCVGTPSLLFGGRNFSVFRALSSLRRAMGPIPNPVTPPEKSNSTATRFQQQQQQQQQYIDLSLYQNARVPSYKSRAKGSIIALLLRDVVESGWPSVPA